MIEKIAIFCKNLIDWFKSDRCFVSYFTKAFGYSNNLLLFAMVLFLTMINTLYLAYALQYEMNPIITMIIFSLLSAVSAAGVLNIIKSSLDLAKQEEGNPTSTKSTFDLFYSGIGLHFLKFWGMFAIFFILAIFVMIITFILCNKFICPVYQLGIDKYALFSMLSDSNQLYNVIPQLSAVQLKHLLGWVNTFDFTTKALAFVLILWIPEMLYSGKNIIVTLASSVKKVFTDFWNVLCIFLIILLGYTLIAMLCIIVQNHRLLSYLCSLLGFYWLIHNLYTVFLYYKQKYIDSDERG